ncbi:MAG: hypothetical protein AUK31_08855 [Fibrobacteres bacterium CG2_30_45_31]|nr:MAG: hypothetical protein AUK31_08855 [Fibrobacteres bacterium CG2_30_45_31]
MPNVNVNTMEPGDILVFNGEEGDWLGEAIMWLTDSQVSHSALFVQNDPPALADAALAGLQMHKVANEGSPLRPVHVGRLTNAASVDRMPIVEAAKKYVAEGLCYPKPALVLLGMILIYKKFPHISLRQSIVIKLLKLATADIKKMLDETIYKGKHPMSCSEFVYQCYLDASKCHPELKLELQNADISMKIRAGVSVSLVDHLQDYLSKRPIFPKSIQAQSTIKESPEELAKMLMDSSKEDGMHSLYEKNDDLSLAVRDFLLAYAKAHQKPVKDYTALMDSARENEAFFVTPSDLYKHMKNVTDLGGCSLYRDAVPLVP